MTHYYVSSPKATGLVTIDEQTTRVVGVPPIWRRYIGGSFANLIVRTNADRYEKIPIVRQLT